MDLNDYDIPSQISSTNKSLYPVLDHELPDEARILDQVPSQLDDKLVSSKLRPSPAPRRSLKLRKNDPKPIPKPRQLVPERNSQLVDNPVYFTFNVEDVEESGDGDKVKRTTLESGEKDAEIVEEIANVVSEFDPLAPGRCRVKDSQQKLRLTNSIFCPNLIIKVNDSNLKSTICQNNSEEEISKSSSKADTSDSVSISSLETVFVSDICPPCLQKSFPTTDKSSQNGGGDDDDSGSCCSLDLEPPPFPPPPLPDGFSASTLDLNSIANDQLECTENEEPEEQPVPPPRYAVVKSPDKPALPPKLNRCNTPDGSISGNSNRGSMISTCSDLSTSTFYSCSYSIKDADTTSVSSANLCEDSNLDQNAAPPLPPKSKVPSKKTWRLMEIVRSGSRRFSGSRKSALLNQLSNESQNFKSRQELAAKALRGIPISGYLHKTGSNRKEFRQRWCVLENNHFKYYLDDKSEIPQGAILQEDIMSVGSVPDAGNVKSGIQLYCFEIATIKEKGRCYLFGSSTQADLERWMEHIAISIAPEQFKRNDRPFTKAGLVYLRYGMTGIWQEAWLFLQEKTLTVTCLDEEKTESFDLRKVTSLEMHPADRQQSCSEVIEEGSPFHLDFPRKSIFIQANLRKETDNWFMLLRNSSQASENELESQQLTYNNVPIIVDKCVNFVTIHGTTAEGIYRLNGVNSKVTNLLMHLKQDARNFTIKIDEYSIHDVASTLKRFFRSLSEPLLTRSLYSQWLACRALSSEQEQLTTYEQLLKLLPEINYCTLRSLIGHLKNISDASDRNRMSIRNIASIFGPTLLAANRESIVPTLVDTNAEMDVIADLITNYQILFNVTTEELKKDLIIQKALMDIKEAANAKRPAGDILMGVYVYSKDWGKCLLVPLSPKLTAKELCIHAIKTARMKECLEHLSIYEVVCNGELERSLHYSEIVLDVTLRWASWASEEAKGNYLVIKKNELYHSILPLSRYPLSMFSELRYADRKSKHFKKFPLEFKNARLSFYRDDKNNQPDVSWNIEDITWYLGCESKRQAPSQWAITFIQKADEVKRTKERPYFGHTVCYTTEEEFHKWVAAMLVGEYPNAFLVKRDVVDLLT